MIGPTVKNYFLEKHSHKFNLYYVVYWLDEQIKLGCEIVCLDFRN